MEVTKVNADVASFMKIQKIPLNILIPVQVELNVSQSVHRDKRSCAYLDTG